uniref:Nudix hydrolase domain-containing protein n=1 Tax=viral metagenome TaxID=1070528 RepID=A0A6C0BMS9_9ZZZZ
MKEVHGKYLHQSHLYVPSSVGVICFTIDPSSQNIYLLLGQESDFHHLRYGNTGKWCDFGGKPKDGETLAETAARELTEEGLGTIMLHHDHRTPFADYEASVCAQLEQGDYDLQLRVFWGLVLRVYYLKEIPWQPSAPELFMRTRKAFFRMAGTQRCPYIYRKHPGVHIGKDQVVRIRNTFLEKYRIAFWSLDRLSYVVNHYGRYKTQRFRSSFRPILKFLIGYFRKYYV